MRSRNNRVRFWLSEDEHKVFMNNVACSGLKMEVYLRLIIGNRIPKERPPLEYHQLIKELHYIGHNLNQIATKANATGNVDAAEYQRQAHLLQESILKIMQAVELPERK